MLDTFFGIPLFGALQGSSDKLNLAKLAISGGGGALKPSETKLALFSHLHSNDYSWISLYFPNFLKIVRPLYKN